MVRDAMGLGRRVLADGLEAALATAAAAASDLTGRRPDDPLAMRDPDYIRATMPAYRALTQLYFRTKVRGLENIPDDGPALLVGNHSGGTLIADTFAFAYEFIDHFGTDRLFHQLAHDMVFKVPGLVMVPKYGTVPASHENAHRALERGAALLVYPGGDYESYRPTSHANKVEFGGRSGFVKLALDQDVPIVPVVAIGGQETALFITRGEGAAKLLQLDKLFRLKVLPIQFAPPYGLTVLDLPGRIPLPAQITLQVLPPMDLRAEFGAKPDRREVYEAVTAEMQRALDELAAERDLPVVGSVTPRAAGSAVADEVAETRSG
jgi:1-acyl-sn-glycerol-3-phosphate acyltransferase